MKDANRLDGRWNGNPDEWQGNRRMEAGRNQNRRTGTGKNDPLDPETDSDEEYGWQDGTDEEEEEPEDEKKKRSSVSLLTTIQIISCCVILAAVLALKMTGNNLYAGFHTWYASAVNDSIIAQEQMDQARRSVIGFWTTISSAGPQQAVPAVSSALSSSQTAVSSGAAVSSSAAASQTGSAAKQSSTAENSASGETGKGSVSSP